MQENKEIIINSFDDLQQQIIDIKKDFKEEKELINYFNTREYEEKIRKISDVLDLSKIKYDEIVEKIKKDIDSFMLYFIIFTKLRRSFNDKIIKLKNDYGNNFDSNTYRLVDFIDLLYNFNIDKSIDKKENNIKTIKNILEDQNNPLHNHIGVMNLYVEMICDYYETNILELDTKEGKERIKDAIKKNEICIKEDEITLNSKNENNKSNNVAYSKFHLNKGRLLFLKGDYEDGEEKIREAIMHVDFTPERDSTIRNYEKYLYKSISIKNEKMLKELEKNKYDSLKQVSLLTTLLGFLLGSIQIFAEIKNTFSLAMMMLGYAGLILSLLGVVLIGINCLYMNVKKNKKLRFIASGVILLLGIGLFVFALLCIYKNGDYSCISCTDCNK